MNRKVVGSLMILLANLIFAAGNVSAVPTWAESFGATSVNNDGTVAGLDGPYGPGYDTPVGIAQMPDGGVVVAGFLDLPELGSGNPTGGAANGALVRYGPDGTILWQELIRRSNSTDRNRITIDQIATDAQGNIFICGVIYPVSGGVSYPYVAKFNSSGALVWNNGFPCNPSVDCAGEFGTMGLTADGGVFVGGPHYVGGTTHAVPAVAKFNSDGSLGFYAPYEYPDRRNSTSAVCQSRDGTKYVFLVQPAGGGFAAVLLNSAGDIVSQVSYPRGGETPIQILATPDGGYVTLSEVSDANGTLDGGVAVRKLNADLSEQFEKVITRISTRNGAGALYGNNIALTSDGGFLIGGDTPGEGPYKAALMKLDSKGVLQFVSVLGGSKTENTTRAIQMSDGGYAFTAATFSFTAAPNANYGKPDWWIVKTDSNRKVQDFGGVMADLSLSHSPDDLLPFISTDATRAATKITDFARISPFTINPTPPGLILEDTSKNTGVNKPTVLVQGAPLPPAPAHGGLSSVTFLVNDSASSSASVADTVLRFRALQTGIPVGLSVRVQATTTPNTESSWADLANDRSGRMTLNVAGNQFVLSSTDYPLQNGVYFRAVSAAPGYSDSISNAVGPFNLVSTKPHLSPTRLSVTAGSNIADLYFRARESTVQNGVALRVQATTTPGDEGTWTDLNNGNAGAMQQSTNPLYPNSFLLLVNNYPAVQGIYFRAVASLSGYVDSISNASGGFNIVSATPPKVTITPPAALSGSGDGHDPDHPILVASGLFSFGATVQTNRALKNLELKIHGATLASFTAGEKQGSVATTLNAIGDHVLEALAVDDLGAIARIAAATYIRVVPGGSSLKAARADGNNASAASTDRVFTAVRDGGWRDPATWDRNNGYPGDGGEGTAFGADFAIIGAHTVSLDSDTPVNSVSIHGGHIIGSNVGSNLSVFQVITIFGGTFQNCFLNNYGICELLNPADINFGGKLFNQAGATINVHGSGGLRGADDFANNGTLNWLTPIAPPPTAALDPAAAIRLIAATSVSNSGLITGNPSLLIGSDGAGIVSHDGGTVISNDGGSLVSHDGAGLIGSDGAGLIGSDGAGLIGSDGAGLIGSDGAGLLSEGGLGLAGHDGATNQSRSSTSVKAAAASTGFMQTGGETDLTHVLILGSATINGGSLTGSGIVVGDVTNNSFISPGHPAGGILVTGNYTQGAQGTLIVENGGAAPNQYDHLQVNGTASLNGKLDIRDINGYTPSTLDTFSPLGFKSATGSFSSVSSNAQVTMTANGLLTSVNASAPAPKPGQPLNISTRMKVLAGDNALIAGFIVTGPNGSTKKVLIRGIGPSLANFGVPGTISDPLLELHKPDGTVVVNDNWQQGDISQIPNGFAPSDPRESVIVATLAPGNYTAVLKGAHGETGVGLAEVYDLDSASAAQLANISTRGFVNTGDNVMIGGFIVGGSEPTKVLVRAIGPSLTAFGVQGALPATTLELHDANGAVISNQGWRNTQEADITATTIPPSNDNEAAILATLVPGNYTAVVRGKNGTTGIGLVEAYNLQ
jgi:hypothetical protein